MRIAMSRGIALVVVTGSALTRAITGQLPPGQTIAIIGIWVIFLCGVAGMVLWGLADKRKR